MNPFKFMKEYYGISPTIFFVGIIVYVLVGLWKGWVGILLVTIGNILFVFNRVIIKAEQGAYDDEELKWGDTKK